MTPNRSNILVRFHDKIETPSGILIPERYTIHEQQHEGDQKTVHGVTTDRRLINPQVVDVLSGTHKGEQAFVYYGAYETAIWPDDDTAIIKDGYLLFLLNPIRPLRGIHLGEEVQIEADRTESGLYRSTNTGGIDGIKVRLIHTSGTLHQSGDIIITQDSAQYWLIYEGKKYLMVKDTFIAGYYVDGILTPSVGKVIVQPEPDPIDSPRQERNARVKAYIEFMTRHGMHYDVKDFVMEEEPKVIPARILSTGEKCLMHRSGVRVGDVLIVEKEAILCLIKNDQLSA